MKVQLDPLLSSSSRRETSPAPPAAAEKNNNNSMRAKSIGCMSAFFHLLNTKHHNRRRRRFLTFGKKQQQENKVLVVSSPPKSLQSTVATVTISMQPQPQPPSSSSFSPQQQQQQQQQTTNDLARLSCCRSPTLPPEIRRSNPSQQTSTPSALVARLMGLDNVMELAEKRRRLLGALEKCDEDLKALKNIIEVVIMKSNGRETTDQSLQPSPVVLSSLLHHFISSTPSSTTAYSRRHTYSATSINGGIPQQQKKKPGEEEVTPISICLFDRMSEKSSSAGLWCSKAMVESVNEVCRDIGWGERREIGRIGLALQDYICRDLIEEVVREMGCIYALPFESCKKRLRF